MAEPTDNPTPAAPKKKHRVLLWILGILGTLILLVFIASFVIDEPLRRMTERRVNDRLKGYTVKIEKLHLQLIWRRSLSTTSSRWRHVTTSGWTVGC